MYIRQYSGRLTAIIRGYSHLIGAASRSLSTKATKIESRITPSAILGIRKVSKWAAELLLFPILVSIKITLHARNRLVWA